MDSDVIIHKIIEKTGMTFDDVNRKILNKRQELSNLVSKDGAAYILAKELGLDLFEKTQRRLEVKNVVSGIKNLNLNARVYRIFPVKEFEYKGRKSKVANIILSDQTGTIRMSLWDIQLSLLDKIKVGQAVEIFGAYTRDNNGNPEIRLSRKGGINIIENSDIPMETVKADVRRGSIAELKEDEKYEVRAAIVQLFDTNMLYEICPNCKTKVKKENGSTVCAKHGAVIPEHFIVLNGVIDDGTGNVRTVFFRENALKIMGMKIEQFIEGGAKIDESLILGKEFIFEGSMKKNKMFNKMEFVVSSVKDVNIKSEVNKIINDLNINA